MTETSFPEFYSLYGSAFAALGVVIIIWLKIGRDRRHKAKRKQFNGPQGHEYPETRFRVTDLPMGWSWPGTSSRIVHANANRPPDPPYSKPPRYEVHKIINAEGWTILDVDVLYKDEFRIIEILPGQVERIEDGKGETAVVLKDKTTLYLLTWKYAPAEIRLALEGKS